ncbi:SDR family oxidoreductase [Fundidesulfovibrio terrae]|uniref:SDR family oxidoreductase n=1 Tax=Fundidesulfovibrio terrae TaxID=2922866 RepID=UPI001FAE89BA|nr:SDR family oxidoreductase [Fundidesulfovibrio terrae]
MLFYPPGRFYQRGEDRSQGNVENSTATTMRAPNDLGYAAATLKAHGFEVFLRDYQTSLRSLEDLLADFERFAPDAVFVSITNATIFRDLSLVATLKERRPDLMVMLKGAIFFNPEEGLLDQLDLSRTDYLIGLESDFIVGKLVQAHFFAPEGIPAIRGILYKSGGAWKRTFFDSWETDLDSLPFPDRALMENHLYVRPDTGEPQATIATSRGCPSRCIFCVTPTISGVKLRLRSPENILAEMRECYHVHGIRDFFFKSDTFTIDQKWTLKVCQAILDSDLAGKVRWVANSKVKPLSLETLQAMKRAGCWLVAFGYESGHAETLARTKKGTTLEENVQAARWAKEAGLLTFGFFLVGMPWETREHLEATRRHIFELDPDFLELHIAVPYPGTELHAEAVACGLIEESVLGKDYFNAPTVGTVALSMPEIEKFRRDTLLGFHLRPSYIWRKLLQAGSDRRILANYFRFGLRLLKNTLGGAPKKARKASRVLVLGANSDIGLAIAREFASREGADLILASRDTQALEAKAAEIRRQYGVEVDVAVFDATDTASHASFYQSLPHKPDGAVLAFGLLEDADPLRVLDVNLMGAASILETVARDFEERREGFIIGLSSVAGERGRKSNYAYGAAKAGLTTYLSGLRHRLFASNVPVLTVTPGYVRSKMTAHLDLPGFLTASPERAAKDVHAAWRAGKDSVYTLAVWRPIMWIIRNLPEFLFKRTNL